MPNQALDDRYENVRYVSMTDFIRQIDEIETIDAKLAFATRYLLSYGAGQDRDVSYAEAIHIAQMKIADASAAMRKDRIMVPNEAVDPDLSAEDDAPNRRFMLEPVAYLQEEAHRLLIADSQRQNPNADTQRRITEYQLTSAVLAGDFNGSISHEVEDLEIESNARDVEARLKAKLGGARELERAYKATKPGVLSKMFGTYSKAYANLDEVYNGFNNPDHALYGNLNALDKAATEYLRHVFPTWNPKTGMVSKSACNSLKGTQKERALFSLNLLKASAEQRKSEGTLETIVNGNRQARAEAEANAGDEVLENQGNEFQQGLLGELEKDEQASVDSAEAEAAYHANFVDVPEEEDDPPSID